MIENNVDVVKWLVTAATVVEWILATFYYGSVATGYCGRVTTFQGGW